jgi:hypothetical protein
MLDKMAMAEGCASHSALVERAVRQLFASHELVPRKRVRSRS